MIKQFLSKLKTKSSGPIKFGTFGGVFTPDVLTILGIIMYLRLGWVVGNAGLLGAFLIIAMAKIITIATGLSMASITTNIKIGAGGPYSIISKSLGLEAGGSIGIPFYFSQTLSTALYIVGFTEGWLLIFPTHSPILVSLVTAVVILGISYSGAKWAIRVQYIILVVILLSIISFMLSPSEPVKEIVLVGNFEDGSFWYVFAIFFPAVTGIMAGANLSGDLKNPRKAIPQGTLSAIAFTFFIYLAMAYFAARLVDPETLRSNQTVMVEVAWIGQLVILGILAATFSSGLGSMIGAPRILQALAEQKTIPFSEIFKRKNSKNEPINAIIFTSVIVAAALVLGNLNALASIITLFFLITYGMLNLVVFIQQSMNIISFRPTFKIPKFIPLVGAIGCLMIMMMINPIFSVFAIITIIYLYIWLSKKGLRSEWGDLRGGIFLVLAELASRIAIKFPRHQVSWKPDLLLPIENPKVSAGPLLFIRNITYPSGSIFAFSVKDKLNQDIIKDMEEAFRPLKEQNLLVHHTIIENADFLNGAKLVIQTLRAITIRPNSIFLTLGNDADKDKTISSLVEYASINELGIIILRQHKRMAFGMQKDINLWLRDKSSNLHLAILLTLQLQLNWEGKINLITVAINETQAKSMRKFLNNLSDQTRLPSLTEFHVLIGNFKEVIKQAPRADINIFGIGEFLDYKFMREVSELTNSSCLFVKDSGKESAVA